MYQLMTFVMIILKICVFPFQLNTKVPALLIGKHRKTWKTFSRIFSRYIFDLFAFTGNIRFTILKHL